MPHAGRGDAASSLAGDIYICPASIMAKRVFMSKLSSVTLGLFSAVIGGAIVAAVLIWVLMTHPGLMKTSGPSIVSGTGYQQLQDFHCRFGEEKHLRIRGEDDDFAFGTPELTRDIDKISAYPGLPANSPYQREYDESGPDRVFTDTITLPKNIVSGKLVLRIDDREDYGNDTIALGDFSVIEFDESPGPVYAYNAKLRDLKGHQGWSYHGRGLYSVRLKDIKFKKNHPKPVTKARKWTHLVPYLADQPEPPRFDILIADDTAVDFIGMALCTGPTEPQGLTFVQAKGIQKLTDTVQAVGCHSNIIDYVCNPYYGDTPCSASKALACYHDRQRPAPKLEELSALNIASGLDIMDFWGGGDLEYTEPVRGDSFETLNDANALCERRFGEGWRVLDFHDGGEKNVVTYASKTNPKGRFWIDIRDQPAGTCWARPATSSAQTAKATP